ncbi:BNR repeat-containing protein [Flavobacteriaceae bacterium GSB9]|nr:BNR repeat-containing protein [Flavobacteriaceae bacterium GSB9]
MSNIYAVYRFLRNNLESGSHAVSFKKKYSCFKTYFFWFVVVLFLSSCSRPIAFSTVGKGWSNNSVNVVKFRKNALTTFGDYQFVAYYDQGNNLVLGKRKLNTSRWETLTTSFKGHAEDAHNSISIAVDGNGVLHVSWDHHNSKLKYARGLSPLSLKLGETQSMTGNLEEKVTYPEFYNLPNGNLLFFYRSGQSGRGNLVINSYNVDTKQWQQIQNNLIDGEGQRSAYWQACVDNFGTIHVSWIWRETWDVETNHDLCYAKSTDGGKTWRKSNGEKYELPITLATAEYALKIPQNSNLINQTAMVTDQHGAPFIASYWSDNKIPQYHVVYLSNGVWEKVNTGFRKTAFVLGGGGTKRIPISRPDIFIDTFSINKKVNLIFRDAESGNRISLAHGGLKNNTPWKVINLTQKSVGEWEPNYDVSLWKSKGKLNVFVQDVTQIDGEGVAKKEPTIIKILEIKDITKLYN